MISKRVMLMALALGGLQAHGIVRLRGVWDCVQDGHPVEMRIRRAANRRGVIGRWNASPRPLFTRTVGQ